ncbi:hypothetical protein [Mycobacterium montefiorense]|uniref:hypothetical protein n=1 Tax=Mycobacterium montefiorense TaxID=154654 RepID=UPI0021DCD07E|nr:hypothetical protein ATCCBAA256_16740 [Mycobacterium montefiorense]
MTRPLGKPGTAAAATLVAGSALEASLIAGVAVAQLGGTDNLPTVGALPSTADTGLAGTAAATCPGDVRPAPNDDLDIAAKFVPTFASEWPASYSWMASVIWSSVKP